MVENWKYVQVRQLNLEMTVTLCLHGHTMSPFTTIHLLRPFDIGLYDLLSLQENHEIETNI